MKNEKFSTQTILIMKKIIASGTLGTYLISLFLSFPLALIITKTPLAQALAPGDLSCTYINSSNPIEPFIGEDFNIELEFDNLHATDVGFKPIVEMILPPQAIYNSAQFSVGALNLSPTSPTPYTVIDNDGGNPLTGDITNPVTGAIIQDVPLNSTYLLFVLPIGTIAPDQLPVSVIVNASLVSGLTPEVNLSQDVQSQCTFAFGMDQFNNPGIDPIVSSGLKNIAVKPKVLIVNKEVFNTEGDNDEVATGENYPYSYTISADIANNETVSGLQLTEVIPNNIQLLTLTSAVAGPCTITYTPLSGPVQNTTCGALPYAITGVPNPGGTLTVDYTNPIVGGGTAIDASLTYDAYIPEFDANGIPVLDPTTGAMVVIPNDASGTGTHFSGPVSDTTDNPADIEARSFAIQKGVVTVAEAGPVGFSPGDQVRYSLTFEVSDYFAFKNNVIEDLMPDGVEYVPGSAVMSLSEGGATTSGITFSEATVPEGSVISGPPYDFSGAPCSGCTLAITKDSVNDNDGVVLPGDGQTKLVFDISTASAIADELVGDIGGSATTGTITFDGIIQESYIDSQPNDTSVDATDDMFNSVQISGAVTSAPQTYGAPGPFVFDSSGENIEILEPTFAKDIVAYDDNTVGMPTTIIPSPLLVSPGDHVIFRLEVNVPTGDMEDLRIQDYLPIPLFDEVEFNGGGCGFDAATIITPYNPTSGVPASIPAPCMIGYGNNSSGIALLPTPIISTDPVNNALNIDFPDDITFEETPSDGITLELLLNATITDTAFDDGLAFVNFAAYTVDNSTASTVIQQPVIIDVETVAPQINFYKGAIATDKGTATFSPVTVGPATLTYQPPGSAPSITSFPVSSTDLTASPISSDITNVDAGDLVTFALAIENIGRHETYDLIFTDVIPTGFQIPGGGLNLQVREGDGTLLTSGVDYSGGLFGVGGTSITMDPSYSLNPLDVSTQAGGGSEGKNILIITYDLEIDIGNEPKEVIENDASITRFGALSGGVNYVTGNETQYQESSSATISDLVIDKTVFSTDQAHTPGTAVVPGTGVTIGEVVTYSVPITLPEGTTTAIQLNDNLPARLGYFIDNGVTVTGAANCASAGVPSSAFNGTLPVATVVSPVGAGFAASSADLQVNLTDVTTTADNDTTNNTFCVQYDVGILDLAGNTNGTNRQNSVTLTYGSTPSTTGAQVARVDILEPNINIAKSVLTLANAAPVTIDANDILKYRIVVNNDAANKIQAQDITITDNLSGLKVTVDTNFGTDTLDNDGDGLIDGADTDELLNAAAPFWNAGTSTFTWNNSTTNGANYTALPLANNITIEFKFTVNTNVLPKETITNTGSVSYTSRIGTPVAPLFERTYNENGNGPFTITDATLTKIVSSTSETGTTAAQANPAQQDLVIGEQLTYTLTVNMPESDVTNLVIQDVVPQFLRVDSATIIDDGFGGVTGTVNITDANPIDTINDTVQFSYPTYTNNTSTDGPDDNILIFEVNATVINNPANNDGDQLVNTGTLTYDSRSGGPITSTATIDVVEANLNVTKVVIDPLTGLPLVGTVDAGKDLIYQFTINHDALSHASAFDTEMTDIIPTDVNVIGDFATDSLDNDGDGLVDGADPDEVLGTFYNGGTKTFTWNKTTTNYGFFDELPLASSMTFSFYVTVGNGVAPDQIVTNTANLDWDSTSVDLNPDERSYSDSGNVNFTVDNVATSKTVTNTSFPPLQTGTGQFNPVLNDLAIGEEVTYQVTVGIPESTSIDFRIRDQQLPGLEIISGSLVNDDGVGHTLAPNITISDLLAADGIDDTIEFDFGDVTNPPDGDIENMVVEIHAIVRDNVANSTAGNPFNNTASTIIGGTTYSTDTESVEIVEPSLTISKSVLPITADGGDLAVFTIVVNNVGSGPAFDLNLTDTVPSDLIVDTNFLTDGLDNNGDGVVDEAAEGTGTFFTGPSSFTWNNTTTGVPSYLQLDPGGSFTLQFQVTLSGGVNPNQIITNTANIDYDSAPGVNPDERSNSTNDDATITVPFTGGITKELRDLVTEKTVGDIIPYRITAEVVEGTSPSVKITDSLPAGLAYIPNSAVISTNNPGDVSWNGTPENPLETPASLTIGAATPQNLEFNFGDVENNNNNGALLETIIVEYDAVVLNTSDNNEADTKVNTANVDYNGTVVGPASAPVITINEPDLTTTKTTPYTNGDTITYTVSTYHPSAGDVTAFDVDLTDTLPAGVTYDGNITVISGPTPTVDITNFPVVHFTYAQLDGTVLVGSPAQFTYDVEIDLSTPEATVLTNDIDTEWTGVPGTITDRIPGNTLSNERTGDPLDPGGAENDYLVNVQNNITVTRPNLSTSTKDIVDLNGGNLEVGDLVQYTVTINNTGNSDATGVQVLDDIPTNLTNFTVISIPPLAADNSLPAPAGAYLKGLLDIQNIALDAAGGPNDTQTIVYQAQVAVGTTNGTIITNLATIIPGTQGGNPGTGTTSIPVVGPILTLNKSANPTSLKPNEQTTFTITVQNTGPGSSTNLILEDTLPPGLTSVGGTLTLNAAPLTDIADGDEGQLIPGGFIITIPNLAPAQTATITFKAVSSINTNSVVLNEVTAVDDEGTSLDASATINTQSTTKTGGSGGGGGSSSNDPVVKLFDDGQTNVRDNQESLCRPYIPQFNSDACLELNPQREIQFNDLALNDDANPFIITLKNTKIINEGDYVVSGTGNHSTGKQQGKFQEGVWEYQPNRNVSRLEVVKVALVSNCIPVEDTAPIPQDGFRFSDLPIDVDPSDEALNFASRAFYTAYKYGIVKGFSDGSARPFELAPLSEVNAIGLRAANAIPDGYNTSNGPWYTGTMEFSKNNGILDGVDIDPNELIERRDFAKLFVRFMAYNPNPKIHGYIERVDIFNQKFISEAPIHEPIPDMSGFENKPDSCSVKPTSCLKHDPDRKLAFDDEQKDDWSYPFVDMLRTSKIIKDGDYIASGTGNHSTGRQESVFQTGIWNFEPDREATRLEVLKVVLVSNCITVEDTPPVPTDGFIFEDLPLNTAGLDQATSFASREFYTAYKHGIVKDIYARPFDKITYDEAVAMFVSAGLKKPTNMNEKLPFINPVHRYVDEVTTGYEYGAIGGYGDKIFRSSRNIKRKEMARMVFDYMLNNQKPEIRNYAKIIAKYYGIKDGEEISTPTENLNTLTPEVPSTSITSPDLNHSNTSTNEPHRSNPTTSP